MGSAGNWPRNPDLVILAKAGIHRACQRASKPIQIPCRAKIRLDTRLRGYDGVYEHTRLTPAPPSPRLFQLPASSFQLPASSFQLPASSFQLPASSFQQKTLDPNTTPAPTLIRLQLAACSLQLAACSLQLAACSLQLAACSLQLAACSLQLAACSLLGRNMTFPIHSQGRQRYHATSILSVSRVHAQHVAQLDVRWAVSLR